MSLLRTEMTAPGALVAALPRTSVSDGIIPDAITLEAALPRTSVTEGRMLVASESASLGRPVITRRGDKSQRKNQD